MTQYLSTFYFDEDALIESKTCAKLEKASKEIFDMLITSQHYIDHEVEQCIGVLTELETHISDKYYSRSKGYGDCLR